MSLRGRAAMRARNRRWSYLCQIAVWAPIDSAIRDIIDERYPVNVRRYIDVAVANQPTFDRDIQPDDVHFVLRSRALLLDALARAPLASGLRDALWPAGEENKTRFDVCTRAEKRLCGAQLIALLPALPTIPPLEVFESQFYRTEPISPIGIDEVTWTHAVLTNCRYTEELRSTWGEVLAFIDTFDARALETTLATCELGVVLSVIQRIADLGRAIELVQHAPTLVAIASVAMLLPERGERMWHSREMTDAFSAFEYSKFDAEDLFQRALEHKTRVANAENALWSEVEQALRLRRNFAAPLCVIGNAADDPAAQEGLERALCRYPDSELQSAIGRLHGPTRSGAGDLVFLRRAAIASGAAQTIAVLHEIGRSLGSQQDQLRFFDPVAQSDTGLSLYLDGIAAEALQDLNAYLASLNTNVDATVQLLRGRYTKRGRDAKNGALSNILATTEALHFAHKRAKEAPSNAPSLESGLKQLTEHTARLIEWFEMLDVSSHLMARLVEYVMQSEDRDVQDHLQRLLARALSFQETIESWAEWLPLEGPVRQQLLRELHEHFLHEHALFMIDTHRFHGERTPVIFRPFLEMECLACEGLVLSRIAELRNEQSVMRELSTAVLVDDTNTAMRAATELRMIPLVHDGWRRFRNALVSAAQRRMPRLDETDAPTRWCRRFEAELFDRTSILAAELA